MPRAGDVIAGKYAIVRVLGEGGMGIVYEATHVRLRQRVAVKMLLPEMLEHEVVVSRFEREARAAGQLRGRHIARVNDVDLTADGLPYMVMDFLEGHDLQVELDRRGHLSIPEAVDYILQACAAMVEAHQVGIIHRDLKPSNLFLAREGDGYVVKVLDFGISKFAGPNETKLTDTHDVMGTAMYMSPEQVKASHAVDARSDIWALGIILYEALAGRPPWEGSPTAVAAKIVSDDAPDLRTLCQLPTELAVIIHKTLERNPKNRFRDVRELAMSLSPFAPLGSLGRIFAEGVEASGSQPRVAIMPMQFPAAGSASMPSRPRSHDGTAPGWSQHLSSGSRGRTAIAAGAIAFVVGTLAIGAVALTYKRTPKAANPAATTSTRDAPPPIVDPLPPAIEPDTAMQPRPSPSPDPIPVAPSARGHASPRATVTAGAASTLSGPLTPPQPPPPPSHPTRPTTNPLHL